MISDLSSSAIAPMITTHRATQRTGGVDLFPEAGKADIEMIEFVDGL